MLWLLAALSLLTAALAALFMEKTMLDLAGLNELSEAEMDRQLLAGMKTSVDALVAQSSPPVDLQSAGDAVIALKAEVDAKLNPPA